ncbi:zinc finger protein 524 [Alligator mississippiensis]|uniref:zinc finger protein 524 n=1 Tax=Alligator mississippiensis TaxID=8496 RepID=UPI0006EC8828|nr:zinc finger protein 524 [Alligator mississippiensis]
MEFLMERAKQRERNGGEADVCPSRGRQEWGPRLTLEPTGGASCYDTSAHHLRVTGTWALPPSTCYAQPKWSKAQRCPDHGTGTPAQGRRGVGPVSEPARPCWRAAWGPKLHSALTPRPRDGTTTVVTQVPTPKPCVPYHARLAAPGWLLPLEEAGEGVQPETMGVASEDQSEDGGGSPEGHLLLIDDKGVPYTVPRQELEVGPGAGPAQLTSPRRTHLCPVCLRAFLYLSDLERHSITHSELKPHVCRACGKAFKRTSHLERHKHIHTGQRPFRCSVCQKGFRESGELLRHQRVHTGERPFQCPLCRLRFTERHTLRRHAKRKHAHDACCPDAWDHGAPGLPGADGKSQTGWGEPGAGLETP